jgi:hypothetical protein
MASAFNDCTSLTTLFPMDTRKVENFYETWRNCCALEQFPFISMKATNTAERTFSGVTLPPGVWDAILMDADGHLPAPIGANRRLDGGQSVLLSTMGQQAKLNLINAGQWSVSDATE